ncbi:MAG: pyruvate ferredoxin oxidoreductase [Prevotella sp.]|nr:pyruvate ferredoxin oxidoreductase [Prevotella sp.]
MDYKYIEQLLERYWQGETTLQEEDILRSFFSQADNPDIPESIRKYQPLFTLEKEAPLGDDFDERILGMIEEDQPKAKIVTLTSRLMPLFKAAAIVAIILTLGNAAQAPWNYGWDDPKDEYAKFHQQNADSVNLLNPIQAENVNDSALAPKPEAPQYIE